MKSENQITLEAAKKLPKRTRDKAQAAWHILASDLLARVKARAPIDMPHAADFNAAITVARGVFLAELVAGKTPAECAGAARAAFPFSK